MPKVISLRIRDKWNVLWIMELRPGSTMSTMFYINYNWLALFCCCCCYFPRVLFFICCCCCFLFFFLNPDLLCSVIARSLIIISQLRLVSSFFSDIPRALRLLVEEPRNDLKPHKLAECKIGNTANGWYT